MFCLAFVLSATAANERAKYLKADFEQKYLAWREYIDLHPEFKMMSEASSQFTCPQFKEIVKLGPSALPYIVQKIETDPNEKYLWMAIDNIAKVKIYAKYDNVKKITIFPDFPEVEAKENVYIYWWKNGHKSTPNFLDSRNKKWKELKIQNNKKEADIEYRKILDLGIASIHYMIDKVKEGDIELIDGISFLTDGKLKKGISKNEAIKWWKENKEDWLIPFPNKQPVANAGQDFEAESGKQVHLDGSNSSDPDKDKLEFIWRQTGGPTVKLEDADSVKPKFTAPSVKEKTVLSFELMINDGNPVKSVHPDCQSGQSEPAIVKVTILPKK